MGRLLGSLRVRITLLATMAVTLALVGVSGALVWAVEWTGVGQVRQSARDEVDRVASALVAGQPLSAPDDVTFGGGSVWVLVEDEAGDVIDSVPTGSARWLHEAPSERQLADVRRRAHDEIDTLAAEIHDRRADHVFDTRIAHADGDLIVASRTVETSDGARTVVAISPLADVARNVDVVVRALSVTAPLLVLFVAVTTWVAVDRSLRPVERIRQRAEAITHSTLSDRLPEPPSAEELHRLTATLNEMLERIEAGAKRQRDFIADASHELRTPLAAMHAELELALARGGSEQWQSTVRRLLADQRRLEQLATDLLTLARLEETHGHPDDQPVDFASIVAAELGSTKTLELQTDIRSVQVRGSAADLTLLVRNLVDNAARHANRRIAVSLCEQAGHAVLSVEDDGPGIPEPDRDRVFERFTRLNGSRARASGGVGIGLALVQGVAKAHGGSVTVTDAALGGAHFEVQIPVA